jgi:general secretion pathway protein A
MYAEFYSLTNEPFNITPDPAFLYLSKKHAGTLEHLLYDMGRKKGLIVLTGEIGTGKTTLLNTIVQRFDEKTHTAFLIHSQISPLDFYKYVFYEFGLNIDVSGKTAGDLLIALKDFLIMCANNGENCVLIVDEAQNLSPDVLEEIRLLLNFETYDKKLIQIILVGHTQLHEKLNLLESAKLRQRVSVIYNLLPLDDTETTEYIASRLSVAGAIQPIFTDDAIAEIYRCSRGLPRLINIVGDAALFSGFGRKQRTIGRDVILTVEQILSLQETDASTERSIAPVGTPGRDVRGQETALTTPPQTRSTRRGFWGSLLGGIAAGIVLSLVTWSGFVQQPERLTQGIAQFGRQTLAAMPFSTQRTARLLADAERLNRQTVTVPTAPLTESRIESGTGLQTISRLGPTIAENIQAPGQNVRLPGTLSVRPTSAPSATVRPQVLRPAPRVIVVQAGDTLGEIMLQTYKRLDYQWLTMVQAANPGMTNPAHIEVGQRIVLPPLW